MAAGKEADVRMKIQGRAGGSTSGTSRHIISPRKLVVMYIKYKGM
jgi:hypothetical protein